MKKRFKSRKKFEEKVTVKEYGVITTECPNFKGFAFHKGLNPLIMVILFDQLMTIPVFSNPDSDEFKIKLVGGVLIAEGL